MKKQVLLTLLISLFAVTAWADVSVTEKFTRVKDLGDINTTTTASGLVRTGDVCNWNFSKMRYTTDVITVSSTNYTSAWLNYASETQYGELATTNLEGGIKAVSFRWAQFGNGESGNTLKLKVAAGSVVHNPAITRDGSKGKNAADGGSVYEHTFNCKTNGQLVITNVSNKTADGACRILVCNIGITPYLLYRNKDVTVGLKQRGYANNGSQDFINNTGTEGSISYSSSATGVATVDENGVITPISVGTTTITAAWSEGASTTYTLHVVDGIIAENFSKVVQTGQTASATWHGDLWDWDVANVRRGEADTLGLNPRIQATAMRSNTGSTLISAEEIEGGVKNLAFDWRQWGSATTPLTFNAFYSADKENWGEAVATQAEDAVAASTPHTFNKDIDDGAKGNAYLKIEYTSGAGQVVIGALKITPYLLYTTKVVTLDTRHSGTYTNIDLINNTGGGVTYTSSNPAVGRIDDSSSDAVTLVAPGMTTITAAWEGVSTSYTLYYDDVITEDFSKAPTRGVSTERNSFVGNYSEWYYRNARSKETDKLNSNERGFWLSPEASDNNTYLETTTEGGIKKVDFKWREFDKAQNGYKFKMKVLTDDDAQIDQITFTGADSYADNDQPYSKITSIRRNDAKFKIQNLSTESNGTKKGGKLIVGPITITPYLLYTRKSVSVDLADGTYINSQLIKNTASEIGSLSFTSSNTTVAEVGADGEVTLHSPGTTVITATFTWEDSESVSTSYALSVVESTSLIEDFSRIPNGSITVDATKGRSYDGNYCKWWHRNASYGDDNYKLNDGTKGFWLSHTIKNQDNTNAYIESARDTDPYQEGGIKNVSFKWHQFGNGSDQTIKLQIKINNTVKETIEEVGGDGNCTLATTDQLYNSSADVYSKTNAKLTIANVSYKTGEAGTNAQGRVIVGPISITPYLFYLDKTAHVAIGDRYTHPLLDNTDSEGSITYSISPAGIATINSRTGEIVATSAGNATVKATWSEGAFTTYTLRVAYEIPDNSDQSSLISSLNNKIVDVTLSGRTIYCDGDYNTICLPFALSAEQIAASPLAGAKIMDFTNAYLSGPEGSQTLDIRFDEVNQMDACRPYLISKSAASDIVNPVFEDVTISNNDAATVAGTSLNFVGILEPKELTESCMFLGAGNNLYWVYSEDDSKLNAFRAYFEIPNNVAPAPVRNAPARIVTRKDVVTDISTTNVNPNVEKRIENGHLVIIRDGMRFNAMGQRIQ